MLKSFTTLVVVFATLGLSFGQKGFISGTVKDAVTGETVIGAHVTIAPGVGMVTDFDGNYRIEADYGTYTLTVSFIGFTEQTEEITLDKPKLFVGDFKLETITLSEVEVVADVARERETPVAFANVLPAQLEEELASQDLPMVLNTTPGVYATQQGGGDGDARITIRGFNQRNVAVMIDGVPVNDMENGWVYWSNWFGLDAVTRSIQVQRGLGASKIAIPSVGGTMNILTRGIESRKGGSIKQEIGVNGFSRTTFGYNTGRTEKGWGATIAGSYKMGNGWVDQTFTKGYFYFLKIEKQSGKHITSLSAFGAPQSHGQRSFQSAIPYYDKDYARGMFGGSDTVYNILSAYRQRNINQDEYWSLLMDQGVDTSNMSQLTSGFIDTTGIEGRGRKYNRHWGMLNKYSIDENGDTTFAKDEALHERINYFHKPQITLKDFWTVNDKLYISNIAYLSIGQGGGTGAKGSISNNQMDSLGQINWQSIYNANSGNAFINSPWGDLSVDPNYDSVRHKSSQVIRSSINNHFWYGLLSTFNYKQTDELSISGGLDLRSYRGQHWRELYDLVGGDYYVAPSDERNENDTNVVLGIGDKFGYHNDGLVNWGGAFTQLEYKTPIISTFFNLSGAYTGYKRVDYFKEKDIVIGETVFSQAIDQGGYFYYDAAADTGISAFRGAQITQSGDTVFVNNVSSSAKDGYLINPVTYGHDSPEARHTQTPWKWIPGFTVKTGMNYNLNEFMNVFMNVGFISKAQRFNNVINNDNKFYESAENERIKALELGYAFAKKSFAVNLNGYYTVWENKPGTATVPVPNDPDERVPVNLLGMNAVHMGGELDGVYKIGRNLVLEGLFSIGDWKWNSEGSFVVNDPNNGLPIDTVQFNATGIKVGDAAQLQYAGSFRYQIPISKKNGKKLYIKARYTVFEQYYANFDPIDYRTDDSNFADNFDEQGNPLQSWKVPGYGLMDIHSGFSFKLKDLHFDVRGSLLNALDEIYISDATNNDKFNSLYGSADFDAKSAAVFFGMGRRYNASVKMSF